MQSLRPFESVFHRFEGCGQEVNRHEDGRRWPVGRTLTWLWSAIPPEFRPVGVPNIGFSHSNTTSVANAKASALAQMDRLHRYCVVVRVLMKFWYGPTLRAIHVCPQTLEWLSAILCQRPALHRAESRYELPS